MPDRPRRRSISTGTRPSIAAAAAVLLLLSGVAVSACGSSKKASTATTPTITKTQFLAEGNAICKQGQQRLNAAQKALEKQFAHREPSAALVTAYVTSTFAPLIQGQISALRALGAPAGEQAKVTSMLGEAQAALGRVKSNPGALIKEQHPFAAFARTAHAYGLTECATNA